MAILTKNQIKGLLYQEKKPYKIDLKAHKRRELEDIAQDQPLLLYLFTGLCSVPLVCAVMTAIAFLLNPILGILMLVACCIAIPWAFWDMYRFRYPTQPKQATEMRGQQ